MSSTFAKIVKAQRVDQRNRDQRGFTARAIVELAHRARTNTLRGRVKLTVWEQFVRWLKRLIERVV